MGIPLRVEFGPFTNHESRTPVARVIASTESLCAHIHIGRTSVGERSPLFDKGTTTCPSELDIAYSEIEKYLTNEGAGADVVIEPLGKSASLRIDIALQRTQDGETWSLEILLANCIPGAVRTVQIPELTGKRARIKIRGVCPTTPNTPVRIWANEPRVHRPISALVGLP